MSKDIFFSNNKHVQSTISNANVVEKERLSKAFNCLRIIGNFGSRIEVFSDDNQCSYVVDKNDHKFYLNMYMKNYESKQYENRINYLIADEIRKGKYEIYSFLTDKIERVETVYTFEGKKMIKKRHPYINSSYVYNYEADNLQYSVSLIKGPDMSDEFIAQNILHNPTTLMDYVDNFKEIIGINNCKRVDFTTMKLASREKSSHIKFLDGHLVDFDILEECNNEVLHMWLENGHIKEEAIRKVHLPINEASESVQKAYNEAKSLIKKRS